jgi:hypothetical protein
VVVEKRQGGLGSEHASVIADGAGGHEGVLQHEFAELPVMGVEDVRLLKFLPRGLQGVSGGVVEGPYEAQGAVATNGGVLGPSVVHQKAQGEGEGPF